MNNEIISRNQMSFAAFAKKINTVSFTAGQTKKGTNCAIFETETNPVVVYITKPAFATLQSLEERTLDTLNNNLQVAEIQADNGNWIVAVCNKGNGGLKNAITVRF